MAALQLVTGHLAGSRTGHPAGPRMGHPITVLVRAPFIDRCRPSGLVVVHGYPAWTIDSPVVAQLVPGRGLYIDAVGVERVACAAPPAPPASLAADPVASLDRLLDVLTLGGALRTARWARLALFVLLAAAGPDLDLLVVTEDTLLVARLVDRLAPMARLHAQCAAHGATHRAASRLVAGRHYTLRSAGQLLDRATTLFVENLETLRPPAARRLLSTPRRTNIIACCPPAYARRLGPDTFGLLVDMTAAADHALEAALILAQPALPAVPVARRCGRAPALPAECEALLRDYFVEARRVVGQHNPAALYPIYDPARQLTIGITLAGLFQTLAGSPAMTRMHALLSIVVQELHLAERLGRSVFDAHAPPGGSPPRRPPGTIYRYAGVIASLRCQLGLV